LGFALAAAAADTAALADGRRKRPVDIILLLSL
jgi:hypothetical protein